MKKNKPTTPPPQKKKPSSLNLFLSNVLKAHLTIKIAPKIDSVTKINSQIVTSPHKWAILYLQQ